MECHVVKWPLINHLSLLYVCCVPPSCDAMLESQMEINAFGKKRKHEKDLKTANGAESGYGLCWSCLICELTRNLRTRTTRKIFLFHQSPILLPASFLKIYSNRTPFIKIIIAAGIHYVDLLSLASMTPCLDHHLLGLLLQQAAWRYSW